MLHNFLLGGTQNKQTDKNLNQTNNKNNKREIF